jgi:hypothetical protein
MQLACIPEAIHKALFSYRRLSNPANLLLAWHMNDTKIQCKVAHVAHELACLTRVKIRIKISVLTSGFTYATHIMATVTSNGSATH